MVSPLRCSRAVDCPGGRGGVFEVWCLRTELVGGTYGLLSRSLSSPFVHREVPLLLFRVDRNMYFRWVKVRSPVYVVTRHPPNNTDFTVPPRNTHRIHLRRPGGSLRPVGPRPTYSGFPSPTGTGVDVVLIVSSCVGSLCRPHCPARVPTLCPNGPRRTWGSVGSERCLFPPYSSDVGVGDLRDLDRSRVIKGPQVVCDTGVGPGSGVHSPHLPSYLSDPYNG